MPLYSHQPTSLLIDLKARRQAIDTADGGFPNCEGG
jgi:hypothetical protein